MQQNLGSCPLYKLSGEVIHGRGIGKLVGMPTANLQISSETDIPPSGVYVTKIEYKGSTYCGVTNIGTRPTVDNDSEISIETHILNFNQKIYGEQLEIYLFKMLRCISKFEDFLLSWSKYGKIVLPRKSFSELKNLFTATDGC